MRFRSVLFFVRTESPPTTKERHDMKNVMTTAWEIAREAAATFGGSVKSYFAESLRSAWKQAKIAKVMTRVGGLFSKVAEAVEVEAVEVETPVYSDARLFELLAALPTRKPRMRKSSYVRGCRAHNGWEGHRFRSSF